MSDERIRDIKDIITNNTKISEDETYDILDLAYSKTYNETYQSMEAFIHNMNTLHSRAGSQVPFSSINYGTDTTIEGRMIIECVLKATDDGLGNGETPIFPIHIFKLKTGVSFRPEDPNYDLKQLAIKVSANRLYPNFINLDVDYNKSIYKAGKPETEAATMGCVLGNELIRYKLNDIEYLSNFKDAFNLIEENNSENAKYKRKYTIIKTNNVSVYDTISDKFVKVNNVIRNNKSKNLLKVKFTNGYELVATDDHPLPIENKGRTLIKNLISGDKLKLAKNKIYNKFENYNVNYWLEGLIFSSYNKDSFSINNSNKDLVDSIHNILSNLNIKYTTTEYRYKQGLRNTFIKARLERNIQNIDIINSNEENKLMFLAGLFEDSILDKDSVNIKIAGKERLNLYLIILNDLGYNFEIENNGHYFVLSTKLDKRVSKYIKNTDLIITNDVTKYLGYLIVESVDNYNEIEDTYDFETETDTFDISFIRSHNCRTRIATNVHDKNKQVIPGRGNLSFTSINLPRLALKSNKNIKKFYRLLDEKMELVHEQLLERFEIQCKKKPINYPFLMGQGNWLGTEYLGPNDDIREALKNGSLAIGFIGLAETLIALTGKHHGESKKAQKLGLEIVSHMRKYTDTWAEEEHLNYSLIGTPAEGLSGRLVRMDKKLFGEIKGITDKDYYTNSSHVPVYYEISAFNKIDIEAPYHKLENGGHIVYIELDGDIANNLKAFEKVLDYMQEKGCGYMAINHPIDHDSVCGYRGVINDICPRCGRKEGEPMTIENWLRIKGYSGLDDTKLIGALIDKNEEDDRITNSL